MIKTQDLHFVRERNRLAIEISDMWQKWHNAMQVKRKEWNETRGYIFATDTRGTSNKKLPWKNSTTTPKLTQIRDNLHANYMFALFPNEDWMQWQPADADSADADTSRTITAYLQNKLEQGDFEVTVAQLLYDWIDYGNCFCEVVYEHVTNTAEAQQVDEEGDNGVAPTDDEVTQVFSGPRLYRISPEDILFDPTADSFRESAKITRNFLSLGELKARVGVTPDDVWHQDVIDRVRQNRIDFRNGRHVASQMNKHIGYNIDGFGSIADYYGQDLVEVLQFEGTIYDLEKDELYKDYVITVIDRAYVIRMEPLRSWTGASYKEHCGWRPRPDNLWAMGPLDNLVGMQYRIDHLENLKADVFDVIALPITIIKGEVNWTGYGPGAEAHIPADGDIAFEAPNSAVLSVDNQISVLESRMEELAGAPREAMGFRTPGEKTKFEVSSLQNAASRIFQNKITYFEKVFLQPVLEKMLESGRRNIQDSELIRMQDLDFGVEEFRQITKDDIVAKGRFLPRGARHFLAQATLAQELTQYLQTVNNDEDIKVHLSGKKIAELMETVLNLKKFQIYQPNVRIAERLEAQQLASTAQEMLMNEAATPAEPTEEDILGQP